MDTEDLQNQARANGESERDVNIFTNGAVTLQGLINGNLNIKGNPQITINGVVYVVGEVSITGNSAWEGENPEEGGTLVAEGPVQIDGANITYEAPGENQKLAFVSLDKISIKAIGMATIHGVFYTTGEMDILGSGTVNIFGAVAAGQFSPAGGGPLQIVYDENLKDYPPPSLPGGGGSSWWKVVNWQEI